MREIIGITFITVGLLFDFFGCLGLVRFPDVYNRLQAATKCVTLGTCSIMFGSFLLVGWTAAGVKMLFCIVFLLLTTPVAAHALARGAHFSEAKLWEKSVVDKYAEDKDLEEKR